MTVTGGDKEKVMPGQTSREVGPEEWVRQKQWLHESYQRVLATMKIYGKWEGEYGISGALAVLTHTAYHLGAIRQAWRAMTLTNDEG